MAEKRKKIKLKKTRGGAHQYGSEEDFRRQADKLLDEFLADLHNRSISTFLVTNGQHPTAIESLRPITQLYVSVDASTPETLEAIDRPLFKDAWDRLRKSLKCLKDKGQRTVARLTVVKGWNSDEVEGYAKLIALGHCSLVEVCIYLHCCC